MADKKKPKRESHIGAVDRYIPNPTGVKPELDTDTVAAPKMESMNKTSGTTPGGGHYSIENAKPSEVQPEIIRSFKTGTDYVPRTGFYQLHEGEAVIPKEQNPMNPYDKITSGDKKPRKAIKAIHVHATDNGRHVVTHEHHHPQHHKDAVHAMSSVDELAKHMSDHASKIEPQAPSMEEQAPAEQSAGAGASPMGPLSPPAAAGA